MEVNNVNVNMFDGIGIFDDFICNVFKEKSIKQRGKRHLLKILKLNNEHL